MNKKKYYIPYNAGKFDLFFKKIVQYLNQKTSGTNAAWKHIPKEDIEAFVAAYAEWYTAYSASLGEFRPSKNLAKREAYKKAVRHLQSMVNRFLRYAPVTNEERTEMGIPVRDAIRTPINAPAEIADFRIKLKEIRQLEVHYKVKGATSKGKPYGYKGAAIKYLVSDKNAESLEELTATELSSKTPCLLEFKDAQRGKTLSMAIQWMNGKYEGGPWSGIQSTIVP